MQLNGLIQSSQTNQRSVSTLLDPLVRLPLQKEAESNDAFKASKESVRFGSQTPSPESQVQLFEELIRQKYPHIKALEPFQREGVQILAKGDSLLVAAPTGSGKTLIPEFLVQRALNHSSLLQSKRLVYTLPRKAVLNEKYEKFAEIYGEENVGLMTGDVTQNRDAPILFMTAEVWQNILTAPEKNLDLLHSVQTAVPDELHFIGDEDRGTTWEEAIILTPNQIQQVYLSASIGNAPVIVEWLNELRERNRQEGPLLPLDSSKTPWKSRLVGGLSTLAGKLGVKPSLGSGEATSPKVVKLIQADERPVPLRHMFLGRSKNGSPTLIEIFERDQGQQDQVKALRLAIENQTTMLEEKQNAYKKLRQSRQRHIDTHLSQRNLEEIERLKQEIHTLKQNARTLRGQWLSHLIRRTSKALQDVSDKHQKIEQTLIEKHLDKSKIKGEADFINSLKSLNGLKEKIRSLKRQYRNESFQVQEQFPSVQYLNNPQKRIQQMEEEITQYDYQYSLLEEALQKETQQLSDQWHSLQNEKDSSGQPLINFKTMQKELSDLQSELNATTNQLKALQKREFEFKLTYAKKKLAGYQRELENLKNKTDRPGGQAQQIRRTEQSIERQESRVKALEREAELSLTLPPLTKTFKQAFQTTRQLNSQEAPNVLEVVGLLQRENGSRSHNLLPALFVIYSRDGCRRKALKLAEALSDEPLTEEHQQWSPKKLRPLVTQDEKDAIEEVIQEFIQPNRFPELREEQMVETLDAEGKLVKQKVQTDSDVLRWARKGVAAHHAGMLPSEKKLVETLLDQGLLKVVFGTDTLAVGLDAPFRTVVQFSYERVGEMIDSSTLIQTGGRAGRKGKHEEGFYILPYTKTGLETPLESPKKPVTLQEERSAFIDMITEPALPIQSQLKLSTYQILNLLNRNETDVVEKLIQRSLAVFQARKEQEKLLAENPDNTTEVEDPSSRFVNSYHRIRSSLFREGFLDAKNRLTRRGKIASEIPGQNHLLLAKALEQGVLQELDAYHLITLLSTMVNKPVEELGEVNQLDSREEGDENTKESYPFDLALNKLRQLSRNSYEHAQREVGGFLPVPFINMKHVDVIRHWIRDTSHWGSIQNHPERGAIFNAIRRTENMLKHIQTASEHLEMSPLERKTFNKTLAHARKRVNGPVIKRLKSPRT